MTNYLNNKKSRRPGGSRRSGGGTVVQVLTLVGAAVVILVAVVAYEKRSRSRVDGPDEPGSTASVGTLDPEDYYRGRGLQPNVSPTPPAPENPVTVPVQPIPEPPPTPQYRYVGRSDWNRYHRPNCKYALNVPEDQVVYFASAAEARAKGYIPCKICRPPASGTDDPAPTTPTPRTPTVRRPTDPISLPIQDVNVPFPFQVKEVEVITEKSVIRVEITAEVEKPLNRDNILLLARKLVAAEIKKQDINAVSIIMQKKTTPYDTLKWICWVDWAPYGNLVRANEVKAGDYRTHQFDIFQHGTIQLKR